MAGDDMSAELVADPEGALEIDAYPASPPADRGHTQRLGGGIDGEPAAVAVASPPDHSQAHAAAGDGGADVDGIGIVAAGDPQAGESLGPRLDRNHLSDVGNDAGEHGSGPFEQLDRIGPDSFVGDGLEPRRPS